MSETEKIPEAPRTLPTEDGYWWDERYDHPITVVDFGENVGLGGLHGLMGHDCGDYLPVSHASWRWLAPIPTPGQLAAMHAKLAAGQALADQLREMDAAEQEWMGGTAPYDAIEGAAYEFPEKRAAFLAAFPPAEKGGAR